MIKVPKLGLMLIGWGGNNGSTVTAALLANKLKLSWQTKEGQKTANWYVRSFVRFVRDNRDRRRSTIETRDAEKEDPFTILTFFNLLFAHLSTRRETSYTSSISTNDDVALIVCKQFTSLTVLHTPFVLSGRYGSLTQASTVRLGSGSRGEDVYVPMCHMLPLVNPDDIAIDGWDISNTNLAEAMTRAKVLDVNLQAQLRPHMEKLRPRKSIYYPDFIASNQVIITIERFNDIFH